MNNMYPQTPMGYQDYYPRQHPVMQYPLQTPGHSMAATPMAAPPQPYGPLQRNIFLGLAVPAAKVMKELALYIEVYLDVLLRDGEISYTTRHSRQSLPAFLKVMAECLEQGHTPLPLVPLTLNGQGMEMTRVMIEANEFLRAYHINYFPDAPVPTAAERVKLLDFLVAIAHHINSAYDDADDSMMAQRYRERAVAVLNSTEQSTTAGAPDLRLPTLGAVPQQYPVNHTDLLLPSISTPSRTPRADQASRAYPFPPTGSNHAEVLLNSVNNGKGKLHIPSQSQDGGASVDPRPSIRASSSLRPPSMHRMPSPSRLSPRPSHMPRQGSASNFLSRPPFVLRNSSTLNTTSRAPPSLEISSQVFTRAEMDAKLKALRGEQSSLQGQIDELENETVVYGDYVSLAALERNVADAKDFLERLKLKTGKVSTEAASKSTRASGMQRADPSASEETKVDTNVSQEPAKSADDHESGFVIVTSASDDGSEKDRASTSAQAKKSAPEVKKDRDDEDASTPGSEADD
ncbi:hypothetical protein LTR37_016853 [Vermiconidia calcicola]|uniref:Uncharacterized protein n=1 Tax=Vermiconidia calcicola TaxID=1690605 RepID=A0ACC3MN64_9PEZI|nr:hypothetical protein LTR37_016853 [Vermiconidia calcicola]